jgi:hypothetical protein
MLSCKFISLLHTLFPENRAWNINLAIIVQYLYNNNQITYYIEFSDTLYNVHYIYALARTTRN